MFRGWGNAMSDRMWIISTDSSLFRWQGSESTLSWFDQIEQPGWHYRYLKKWVVCGGRYVDDNEIILSLKKMDTDLKWPALLEGWTSLTTGVSELLKGTSIYVVGASTTINWAVAKELATGLGYVFLFHLFILWVCMCWWNCMWSSCILSGGVQTVSSISLKF